MKSKPPANKSRKKAPARHTIPPIFGAAAAALGVLLYMQTIHFGFALDDASVIESNRIVKQGLDGISTIFSTSYRHGYWDLPGTLYRPLSLAMFAVEYALSPDSQLLHHLINVLLYGLIGWLVVTVMAKYLGRDRMWLAFATSLLFMAHPIHTEVVANIKSRDEILALSFALLALLSLHRYQSKSSILALAASLLAYTLALFSKEGAITFLAVFPLMMYFFTSTPLKKIARISAMYILPVALFMMARYAVLVTFGGIDSPISQLDNYLAHMETLPRIASSIMITGLYILKLILPHPLFSDLGYPALPEAGFAHAGVIATLLMLAGLLFIAWKGFRRKGIFSFAILFFFITFSIVSNWIIIIGSSYGERFLFVPSLAFCLALAAGILSLTGGMRKTKGAFREVITANVYASGILAVIVIAYSLKTLDRVPVWKDSFSLYQTDAALVPNCTKLRYHHGLELNKASQEVAVPAERKALLEQAEQEIKAALDLAPLYGDALSQLGLIYTRQGRPDEALEAYEMALEHSSFKALIYSNMGIIFFERGQTDKAIEVYEKSVSLDPDFVDGLRNLGAAYAKTGQFEKAIEQFSEAVRYAPNDATINYYLGLAWRDLGQTEQAAPWFEKARRLNPKLRVPGQ
jgi:Flp pilus assembly protein TadD